MLENQCQPSQRDLLHRYENWKYSYDFRNIGHLCSTSNIGLRKKYWKLATVSESLCLKSKSTVFNLYLSEKMFLNNISQETRMLLL